MMKRAFKTVLKLIGLSNDSQIKFIQPSDEAPASPTVNHFQKTGKGKGRKAHKPSGVAKAKRAAKKMRNKKEGK